MKKELIVRDWLAIERTKMANERTFLAYERTALVLLGTGLALVRIHFFENLEVLGYILMALAPLVAIWGVVRFWKAKKGIKKYYESENNEES